MKRVLIAGATGYLGRYAVQEFKKQGCWVRALARTPEKLETLQEYIDDAYVGEVTDKNSMSGICKDIDIVFSSIGITRQKDNLTFMDVDYQGNINLLEEALKEGTTKFIFVSVFNAENMKHLKGIQAKLRFEEALKKYNKEYKIFIYEGAGHAFNNDSKWNRTLLRQLQKVIGAKLRADNGAVKSHGMDGSNGQGIGQVAKWAGP